MGDAVLRVRGHLQSLALENWAALEERHVRNVSWLQEELTQISRSLEVKAHFEVKSVVSAAYPRAQENVIEPTRKKQKVEKPLEDSHKEEKATRLSMRLRPRAQSVDVVTEVVQRTRKRGRPSESLLQDPAKLTVVDLRSELKKRGLRTSGLKAVLFDRLLDALEVEQKENRLMKKVDEEPEVIVINDDEIVRESVGSNSVVTSQSTSPKGDENEKEVARHTAEELPDNADETLEKSSLQPSDPSNTGQSARTETASSTALGTADTPPDTDSANLKEQGLSSETNADQTNHSLSQGVAFTVTDEAGELITHDVLKTTRKSMQVRGKSELASPLGWKRKSILRKASSLAPSNRPARNVSFAPTDVVDIIVESSQTDSTQPDPSPEKAPSSPDAHTPREETIRNSFESIPEAHVKSHIESVSVAPSLVPTENPSTEEHETEEQRRKREFDESVQREAEKLRAAAILSARKRLEEAKATKAFWAKRDQLKAKLRASSSGDKRKSAHTPVSSKIPASDQVPPPTSELSTVIDSVSSSSDTHRLTTSASKEQTRTQHSNASTRLDEEEAKDHDFMRSMARQQKLESITDVSSAFESSMHETKTRPTFSVSEDDHQVVRSHGLVDKPLAKSMAVTGGLQTESQQYQSVRGDIEQLSKQESYRPANESSILSPTMSLKNVENLKKPVTTEDGEPLSTRDRSDSLSSTVSSISEPSVVENALKSGKSIAANGNRRPIANLVSGLHSFTTLMQKDNSQETSSGRSAPVVNALKLAERSRVAEEKKRVEKEKRKAILRKKMEEHKKAAALKEKAEKDAQAKREQDRLIERKKREAELARRRQQKLKEVRAGLEKKRAMIAAEKKSGLASSAAISSKSATSTTAVSQHKHRGLASISEANQPTAIPKPVQKPVSKLIPMTKPISSKSAPVSKPAPKPVSKSVPRPPIVSPVPAKHAPKSHSPEIVNYEMSDNAESSDSDSDSERHGKKKLPRWAQKDHLNKILNAQFGKKAIDPSPAIFQDFVDTCNLEAIFETTDIRKKKKFARRTSSGNWLADRPTARDRALYQRDMGYDG